MTAVALHALTAFVLSLVLVRTCRVVALRYGYVAKPRADRWHAKPTALMGGVGIALTVLLVFNVADGPTAAPVLMAGATAIFLLGLGDDLFGLAPYTRLIVEIAIA